MKYLLLALFIILLNNNCRNTNAGAFEIPKNIMKIPEFEALLTDSQTIFSTKQIPKGAAIIIFYFDPDCHTCQQETKMLTHNIHKLKGAKILFLGIKSPAELKQYSAVFQLDRFPNITVAKDHTYSFMNIFKLKSLPSMVIYNNDNALVKIIEGEATLEEIQQALKI